MALYATADPLAVRVISKDVRNEMNCNVEMWPYQYMMHQIKGSNGKIYAFDVYVDEDGLCKQLAVNEIATYLCHPFNIARGRVVHGDAIILPLDEDVDYTMEDYQAMYDGVWVRDDESNIDLVEENIEGQNATFRLLSDKQKQDLLFKSLEEETA